MPATRSRTHDATNLLTAAPDEVAVNIVASLGSAVDLLHLAPARSRHGAKTVELQSGAPPAVHPSEAPAAETPEVERWSTAEEGARRWILARPLLEQAWLLPRKEDESWMGGETVCTDSRHGPQLGRSMMSAPDPSRHGLRLVVCGGRNQATDLMLPLLSESRACARNLSSIAARRSRAVSSEVSPKGWASRNWPQPAPV